MSDEMNVLGEGIEITGTISFANDTIIDAKVDGSIESSTAGKVTIGENAVVVGDVKAGEVKNYGKVTGSIDTDRCELKANSRLEGDLTTKSLSMEEGALHSGQTRVG